MGARSDQILIRVRGRLLLLSEREIDWVARTSAAARRRRLERAAIAFSWLGNGALYLLLAALLLLWAGTPAWRAIATAILCGAISHLVYPVIKRAGDRPRPCDHRSSLGNSCRPLDIHSFPSGHAMTLAAACTPVLVAWPDVWPTVLGLWLVMAWARIAVAHHYPSDVLAGTLLGVAVALPVTWVVL